MAKILQKNRKKMQKSQNFLKNQNNKKTKTQ